jgi:hypothetical protein
MNRHPGLVVVAMIAVVSASACGRWQGQPKPRVKLLTSEAAKHSMPVQLSWCTGPESEWAAAPTGDGTVDGQRMTGIETRM